MIKVQIINLFSDAVAAFSTDPAINAYVYLAYRNDEAGTLGIAYTGTTCTDEVKYRTSLNEYQGGDLNTGLVRNYFLKLLEHLSMTSHKKLTF